MNISIIFKEYKDRFEKFLNEIFLPTIRKSFLPELLKPIEYSLLGNGKRLRPVLALATFDLECIMNIPQEYLFIAASLECMHTYSLIHDDLPSMDNDDFRRGRPTLHKQFSESTAILTGDALNALSFYALSFIENFDNSEIKISYLLKSLHDGGGGPGMIGGQILDLYFEKNRKDASKDSLEKIHKLKTGALLKASLLMGNRLRDDWETRENLLKIYGDKIGLLFQITDDILDIEGSQEQLGKTPGKDAKSGKLTYPSIFGIDFCKKIILNLKNELVEISEKQEFKKNIFFKELPNYIVNRKT